MDRFARKIHQVEDQSGQYHNPGSRLADGGGQIVLDIVAMAATEPVTHFIDDGLGQAVGHQTQEHGTPNHDDGEVEEPLPQPDTVGPHQFYPHEEGEQGDEHGH